MVDAMTKKGSDHLEALGVTLGVRAGLPELQPRAEHGDAAMELPVDYDVETIVGQVDFDFSSKSVFGIGVAEVREIQPGERKILAAAHGGVVARRRLFALNLNELIRIKRRSFDACLRTAGKMGELRPIFLVEADAQVETVLVDGEQVFHASEGVGWESSR